MTFFEEAVAAAMPLWRAAADEDFLTGMGEGTLDRQAFLDYIVQDSLYLRDYLKAYAIDCLLTSFLFCFVGYFSGLGKTVFVMTQGILGAFGVRIPVSFAMSRLPNVRLFYIGLATPCSTVVQVLLCLGYYAHLARRERRA